MITNNIKTERKVNTTEFLQAYQALCNEDEPVDSAVTRRQVFDLIFDPCTVDDNDGMNW